MPQTTDKIDPSKIKGVILDCGDVILHAPDHRWWPPPYMNRILVEWGIIIDPGAIPPVMRTISRLLDESHHLHTSIDAENEQFRAHFRLALEMLGSPSPDEALIEELIRMQSDPEWYIVYDETVPVLRELKSRGYHLHMLSNSFRYLEGIMRIKGLDKYFDGMTISAVVGHMKPDDRIYKAALDAIPIPPENLLYIDDIPYYVLKGISLGMQGLVLDRFNRPPTDGVSSINSLPQLLNILASIQP